jgi:exonuclease III
VKSQTFIPLSKKRGWTVLCWNVRGLNSQQKWIGIKSKIMESNCDIICLQETKRDNFDQNYLRKFHPSTFDCFEFVSSHGASRGSMIIWKSSRFSGNIIFQNNFAMSIEFISTFSGAQWVLTNIYAPCTPEGRIEFLDWFHNVDISDDVDWLLVGDFNLIWRPSDHNKPSGNIQDMLRFNDAISHLRLEELQLVGNRYTWTNMQSSPLLERLD